MKYYILRTTGDLAEVKAGDPLWLVASDTPAEALATYEQEKRAQIKARHQQIDELISDIHRVRRAVSAWACA